MLQTDYCFAARLAPEAQGIGRGDPALIQSVVAHMQTQGGADRPLAGASDEAKANTAG
ncbi:hypothetical protein GCM10011495_28600 [Hymenobacter frigidus]|uniref:Uncharacterized protein n=1 Tax=Hymenobacter frigidus TaxID=1524095 RepID=A0ABQ2ABU7_9BACT|nr:hypothetical protein GCM10011495_28600 [Hymenobacter frigidus]